MNSDQLRAALLQGDLSRPRLTWYDEQTSERIDLSGKTLANWVAKAANWLDLEMALSPGDLLALTIPADHWRAVYWSLAAWTRGLRLTADPDAEAVVALDGPATGADLVEPAAALAASPLQAMPDVMPPPVGPFDLAVPAIPAGVRPGSRVLLSDTSSQSVAAVAAAVIGRDCSVLIVRNGDADTRAARRASEAVDVVL